MPNDDRAQKDYREILDEASSEAQSVIRRILKLEYEKLYQRKPRVIDDIVNIVREVVQ